MSFAETEPNIFDPTLLEPETQVGHYQLMDHMATTDMSVVYGAISLVTKEPVALKLPRDVEHAQDLRDEIAVHAEFSDCPSIVTIDGCGVWREQPFLATRLQERGTLKDELQSAQNTSKSTSDWLQEVIDELDHEIMCDDTMAVRDIDPQEMGDVVQALYREGLTNLISDTNNVNAGAVVEVVADAAHELGHDMSADSPLAKATAKELLKKEATRPPESDCIFRRANVLRGIANGLTVMHEAGVVHCDVKPNNAGINREGNGVLIDFGIASRVDSHYIGPVRGTFGGIPPEGYLGEITTGGDVFALAATAYIALTGHRPHPISDDAVQCYNLLRGHDPVSADSHNPNLSKDLSRIIMRGLSKEPSGRPTALDMRDAFVLA